MESVSLRQEFKIGQLELALFGKIVSVGGEARVAVGIYNIASRCFV